MYCHEVMAATSSIVFTLTSDISIITILPPQASRRLVAVKKMDKFHSTKFTWVKIYHRLAPHAEGKACLISDIDIPSAK